MPDEISCPQTCPNRKKEAVQGKIAAYLFAFIGTGFLVFQCNLHDRRGDDVPVQVWMPTLLLIGTALGVQIDAASLAGLFKSDSDR